MGMINKIAKSIYMHRNGNGCRPWGKLPAVHQIPYLDDAEAALSALKEPTSEMIGPVSGNVVVGCCIADKKEIEEIWDWMITLAEEGK
jgi:hypothetical protein